MANHSMLWSPESNGYPTPIFLKSKSVRERRHDRPHHQRRPHDLLRRCCYKVRSARPCKYPLLVGGAWENKTQVTAKLATARGKLKSVGEPREASEGFGFLVFAESAAERILWSCGGGA